MGRSFEYLPPQSERGYQTAITLDVLPLQIVEQAPTLTDQHEEPALTMEVVLVLLHVLGEVLDSLGEQRNLDFGRSRV